MPAQDFWIIDQSFANGMCHGSLSSSADAPTNAQGETTISGMIAGGGAFGEGSYVVVQGVILRVDPCDDPMPLTLVSPDINGDGIVDLADVELFFTLLGNHYRHECTE